MIKGINKQILEVTNTDNPYFEKVIFFVRPQSAGTDKSLLRREAEKIASTVQKPPKTRTAFAKKCLGFLYALLGASASIAMLYVINSIVNR